MFLCPWELGCLGVLAQGVCVHGWSCAQNGVCEARADMGGAWTVCVRVWDKVPLSQVCACNSGFRVLEREGSDHEMNTQDICAAYQVKSRLSGDKIILYSGLSAPSRASPDLSELQINWHRRDGRIH